MQFFAIHTNDSSRACPSQAHAKQAFGETSSLSFRTPGSPFLGGLNPRKRPSNHTLLRRRTASRGRNGRSIRGGLVGTFGQANQRPVFSRAKDTLQGAYEPLSV